MDNVAPQHIPGEYSFDWFKRNIDDLWLALNQFKLVGRPDLRFLEIGSYEGMSAVWTCLNVLTGYNSHLDCVDPHEYADVGNRFSQKWDRKSWRNIVNMRETRNRFLDNTKELRKSGRLVHYPQSSVGFFGTTVAQHGLEQVYDYVFIDGCHWPPCVMEDAVMMWSMLKVGGLMCFDDYLFGYGKYTESVKCAVDSFLATYYNHLRIIQINRKVIVQKIAQK